MGDVLDLVTSSAMSLPHIDDVAISSSETLLLSAVQTTAFPLNSVSFSLQFKSLAPTLQILSLSSMAHNSTALPVTKVVLDA